MGRFRAPAGRGAISAGQRCGRTSLAALRSASDAARDAGHPHAGTTHLLAAVLVEADGPAARLLPNLGADPAAIRRRAVARLATSSP
ncbi:Clp protease N-terminal domain-containing protein [Plantactinospora sp. DSM 117369]